MNSIFKILLSLLILIGQFEFSYAQSASILPPAKTTFVDKNGKPLTSGTVEFYIPGTTTHKMTWQDAGQTIPNANPLTLDGSGRAVILGDGSYRQVLKDRYGNVVWDGYTASTGSGGGGTTPTVGDGDAVGTIKPWAGFIAPYGYVFTYGQELVRASYPEAFAALTSEKNVSCSLGSPTLSSVSDTTQLTIGSPIESPCLNAGATVVSKTINSVVASANAIISTTTTARFFPYGNGDGSSTFNVPDFRGLVIAGRDNMGGIAANRLTTTYFANATGLGATGGVQSSTLNTINLPPYTPSGSVTTITTLSTPASAVLWSSGAGTLASISAGPLYSVGPAITATSSSSFAGAAQGGTQTPYSIVQPTKITNYIIKVIPDVNPNSFFGVASIGGMYGVINCGFGLTCAGNTISAVSSTVPPPTLSMLGGIYLSSAPANQFGTGVDSSGNLTYAQPSFNDISGILALSKGGTGANLTASNGGIFWSNATTGQILAGTANASRPLISGSSATPSWGAFSLPGSVTSGGIAYFNSTSAMSSSALLAANQLMLGGGAGTAPATLGSLGTTTTVLHGNAGGAPTFGQIVNGDITTNTIANSSLAQVGAATFKGNPTGSTANATDFTIQGLTARGAPDAANDKIPLYDNAAGTIKYVTPQQIASAGVAGVSSIAGNAGAFTLQQPITNSTNNILLNASIFPQLRITLISATPVMSTGVAGATTVYVTPYKGNLIPIYDGTNMIPSAFAEVSQTTSDTTKSPAAVTTNSNYDIFCWIDTGPTNRCTRGPAWSSGTSRGTGAGTTELVRVNGILLSANSITNGPAAQRGTYVGTIRSNASSTIDWLYGSDISGGGASVLNVWNAYNRIDVTTTVGDTTASWNYTSATIRPSNNSTNNRISFVSGLAEESISAIFTQRFATGTASGSTSQLGWGLDSTTTYNYRSLGSAPVSGSTFNGPVTAQGSILPQLGSHFIQALESCDGTNTATYVGGAGYYQFSARFRM
jgi:hypothetical protein